MSLVHVTFLSLVFISHLTFCNTTFTWDDRKSPTKQEIFLEPEKRQTLQLLLSDAPLATLHQRVPKYQVFRYDQICDFSSFARLGYNVQAQLGRFAKDTLTYHKNFISDVTFQYEYRFLNNLTHTQCLSTCRNLGSDLPSLNVHLTEIKEFRPPLQDFFWVETNQNVTFDGKLNKYNYQLYFDNVQVFPSNHMRGGATMLYHFMRGEYVLMSSQQLRSRASYYDFTADQYYRKEPYTLKSRFQVDNNFQIFIPMDSTSFEPNFGKSACVCQRKLEENTKNAALAKEISVLVRSSLYNAPTSIESVRVKRDESTSSESNVVSILNKQQKPFLSTPDKWLLKRDDLFPLMVTAPILPVNESVFLPVSRKTRAASIFLSALAKTLISQTAAITSPYILQESANIFKKLITKASMQFPANKYHSQNATNATFQDKLDKHFSSSPADATLLHDRLTLSVKDVPETVYSMYSPDVRHAKAIRRAARKLEIFRDQILTSLPEILLEKVLLSIPYPVRKNSQIIVHVRKSLSFYVISYYVECTVDSYSFTNITAFSMPYIQEGKDFYAAFIQNDILSIDFQASHSLSTLQSEKCAQQALSNVPAHLFPSCKRHLYIPNILDTAFELTYGKVVLILGTGVLQISCFQKASQIVTLAHQFNLFYINHACGFNIKHENLNKYVRESKTELIGSDFIYLLKYDVPTVYSTVTKYYHWLITISVGVTIIVAVLCIIIVILTYCKRKYQPKLSLSQDGAIECTLVNCDTSIMESQMLPNGNPFTESGNLDSLVTPQPEMATKPTKPKLTKPAAH